MAEIVARALAARIGRRSQIRAAPLYSGAAGGEARVTSARLASRERELVEVHERTRGALRRGLDPQPNRLAGVARHAQRLRHGPATRAAAGAGPELRREKGDQ